MYSNLVCFFTGRMFAAVLTAAIATISNANEAPAAFDPMVAGNNSCFMVQAYFPKATLTAILPEQLTIPDDATMAKHYPETELNADAHPFMLSFCHGAKIHDLQTNMNVPEQEEIMFVFPVFYTHEDGTQHLSSYMPVLYLDSFIGVLGGLTFGLRKEYHPGMTHGGEAANGRWWNVEDIIDASFDAQAGADSTQLPQFFEQSFANPFVTLSYPLPFSTMVSYQAAVYPDTVRMASHTFTWNYAESTVKNSDASSAIYAEYSFTMSQPMDSIDYFGSR